jgi:saccharopine dehydrogenase (NAD+, L-lysine-forming)
MIGILRESKNRWERRVPLTPDHVAVLTQGQHLRVLVEPSEIRAFSEKAYEEAGASVSSDLSPCRVVLGVKEIPLDRLEHGKAYAFFAHVAKGQKHNMPMLRRLMELGCSLVDYERIVDDRGRRLIFFGLQAGHSGMIDTLWALGRRLRHEGIRPNPFEEIRQALDYATLADAQTAVSAAGERILSEGLPEALTPFVCAFTGYGNTYRGAAEVFDLLPFREIAPTEVPLLAGAGSPDRHAVYKAVFHEEHTVEPASPWDRFDLQDYYAHPERYRPIFSKYLPHLSVLVNCVYWEPKYPRLVTLEALRELFGGQDPPRLKVIGDISCDIGGSVECTVRSTDSGDPLFVYDPLTGRDTLGIEGRGPVVLAVDNLPCELPVDASQHFGDMLLPFVPALARCPWDEPLERLPLPPEILRAVIVHRGKLAPFYVYLERHLAV